MDKLYEALALIDTIDTKMSRDEIKDILLKAYRLSDDCLDALTLLSRLSEDEYRKEAILDNGLNRDIDISRDDIMARQYIRLLYEACTNYIDMGHLPLALKIADTIYKKEANEENDKAALLFRKHAYYINRITGVIYYMGERS